ENNVCLYGNICGGAAYVAPYSYATNLPVLRLTVREGLDMKYAVLLILVFAIACTQSDKAPREEDFAVTVKAMDETLKINKEIEIVAELKNLSKNSVKILHASPLIHVQTYDEQNNPLVKTFNTFDIGLNHKFKPDELYNPDSKTYNVGKRTIKIEKPGRYKLVGTASFSIELSNEERKDFKISSEPFEITVE
ncbi:MAG: hypothetical protein ACQEXQ_29925, partial [Bacillota bacterium]